MIPRETISHLAWDNIFSSKEISRFLIWKFLSSTKAMFKKSISLKTKLENEEILLYIFTRTWNNLLLIVKLIVKFSFFIRNHLTRYRTPYIRENGLK